MSAEPIETVKRFLAAWSLGAVDNLLAYFAPDGVYHNIPMEPWVGHATIRAGIEGFFQIARDVDFEVTNIAAAGLLLIRAPGSPLDRSYSPNVSIASRPRQASWSCLSSECSRWPTARLRPGAITSTWRCLLGRPTLPDGELIAPVRRISGTRRSPCADCREA